jgi:hypothetical protein
MRAMTIPELMRVAAGVMLNLIAWKQIRQASVQDLDPLARLPAPRAP